jgi:hypothetical protein
MTHKPIHFRRLAIALVAVLTVLGPSSAAWSQSLRGTLHIHEQPMMNPPTMPPGPATGSRQEGLQQELGGFRDSLGNSLTESTSNRLARDLSMGAPRSGPMGVGR